MISEVESLNCITIDHPLAGAVLPVYAQPDVPYLTEARACAQPYVDPHVEFVPTTHEHLRAMCDRHDYHKVFDRITPARLVDLDMLDIRRIFWLVELRGDLRELCRVDRTATYDELVHWSQSPRIWVLLPILRLHRDCYLPAPQPARSSAPANSQPPATPPTPPTP